MARDTKEEDPLMRLRLERKSLSSTNISLGNIDAYSYNQEQTKKSMREMISTQLRPTVKETANGVVIKKVDFFVRQEETPHLKFIRTDSDMEPEPLEHDYLIRLKVQLDTNPVPEIGPVGVRVNAKCYRWEENYGGLRMFGSDDIAFGTLKDSNCM